MNKHCIKRREPLNNYKHYLKIMRITFFFLFFCILFSSAANSFSQEFTFNLKSASIREICKQIEKESEYVFVFSDNSEKMMDQKVNIDANAKNVTEILDAVLSNTGLTYEILDKQIVIYESGKIISAIVSEHKIPVTNIQQPPKKQITGRVVDAQGEAIIGANIVEVGTTNGTVTDVDGYFSLSVEPDATIHISYIGYLEQNINTAGRTNFNITLLEDTQALEELVVIGYGTQRKRDVTGSISAVSSKDLSIQSVINVQNLLQGRMSGVSVSTSGVAGEAPSIRIRGIGTIGNNNPLYVIDGFPTKSEIAAQINPSSIESVQVLKDASSASIYGSQAANGVILITTKQGKSGKTELDVKVNTGVQVPTNLPKMLNSQQYGEVLWNAMRNAGITPSHPQYGNGEYPVIPDYVLPAGAFEGEVDLSKYNTAENQFMRANKVGTDWAKEVYRTAPTANIDISARGGSESSKYFLNANYYTQDAIIKWAGYDRLSLRNNAQFSPMKFLTLGTNMSVTYSKYKGATSDQNAVRNPPLLPVKDVMGNWAGTKANGLGDSVNPVASIYNQKDNYNENLNFLGNLFMEINFLESFQFKTTAGANIVNRDGKSFNPVTFWNKGDKNQLVNSLGVSKSRTRELVWNNTLTYSNKILDNHNINILIGTEALEYKDEYLSASRSQFMVEDVNYRYLDAGELNKDNSENGGEYSLFSLFGRITYQYQDKYYLNTILRRDGSSRFGKNNRYGYFPGISAAWRMSEESFMADQNIVDDLKIRVSYGKTGNQDIGNYSFTSLYGTNISTSSYPITGDVNTVIQGISEETIGNPNIKWETTTQKNIGIDAFFLNNALNITFDYYNKYTTDILQRVTYPATAGVAIAPYENIGEMKNKGLELGINYSNMMASQDFSYDVGLIISGYRNNVEKLAANQFISGTYTRTEVGHPISSFYGYVIDGIFQTQEEVENHADQTGKAIGRWKYKDVDGNGIINDRDRTYIGNPHPKFEYSLNTRLYYKNFDFSLFIQGTYGNDICFASKGGKNGLDFWSDYFNKSTRILDTWTDNNKDAKLPEINVLNPNDEAGKVSTYLIEDGSYLRFKFLELGYTLPSKLLSKGAVESCRVYVNAENFWTITNYNNIDPEVKNSNDISIGVDYAESMPLSRVFSIGLSVSF